jgi:hypothetical protein
MDTACFSFLSLSVSVSCYQPASKNVPPPSAITFPASIGLG